MPGFYHTITFITDSDTLFGARYADKFVFDVRIQVRISLLEWDESVIFINRIEKIIAGM